jgi:hypothetical protein
LLPILALLTACSFLVDFDPEGQPCDKQNLCLEDYACVDGGCVSSPGALPDGGRTDAGADAGRDGGTDGGRDGG